MTHRMKRGDQIKVGDVVVFLGTPHRVAVIEEPSEATQAIFGGECVGVARAADGWGISLSRLVRLEVA